MTNDIMLCGGLLIFFAGLWTVVCWVISGYGWKSLAKAYQAPGRLDGKRIVASGLVNGARYGLSLILRANQDGLSLETGRLLLWHPPLFFPWEEIKTKEAEGRLIKGIRLEFAQVSNVFLDLRTKTVLELKEMAGTPKAFPDVTG